MKKTILPVVAVCATLSFTACDKNDSPNCVPCQEEGKKAEILAEKVFINPFIDNGASRAITEKSAWTTGDKIGVFVTSPSSPTVAFKAGSMNLPYTYTAGKGWSNDMTFAISTVYPKVYAYYPHDVAVTDLTRVRIKKNVDFMHGSATQPVFRNNAADYQIPMKHALTQFIFVMKKGSNYTGAGQVTKLELVGLSGQTITTEADLNLTTGNRTSVTTAPKLSYTPNAALTTAGVRYGDAIIPHNFAANKLRLDVTIDGRSYSFTFAGGANWVAGKRHIYDFTLSDTGMTIGGGDNGTGTGVTIENWGDTNGGAINLTPTN